MLSLLKTYVDVIALRAGPGVVPRSWLVVAASVLLLIVAWSLQLALIETLSRGRMLIALLGYALALSFYGTIISVCGYSGRVRQALSAIIACGSILSVSSLLAFTALGPLLGQLTAGIVADLVWYWSIPVKGHIVAHAIGQHWFVGIVIAMSAYIMRIAVDAAFVAQT